MKITLSLAFIIMTVANTMAQDNSGVNTKYECALKSEFTYHNLPVSPDALGMMFPNISTGESLNTVSLTKNPFGKNSFADTTWYRHTACQRHRAYRTDLDENYYRRNYKNTSQIPPGPMFGIARYIVLGNTSGGKFIILGTLNGGGTMTQCYIFILDLKGDNLIKLGSIAVQNIRDNPVVIQDNVITCGKVKYIIPASAR